MIRVDDFGVALRALRTAAGLSLAELARATGYGKTAVAYIEQGTRRPSADFARSADRALGTTPLFVMLANYRGGDMRRRALLEAVGVTIGAGLSLGTVDLAEVVRHMLGEHAGDDWDDVADGFERRVVAAPTPELGQEVLAHAMILQREIQERGLTPDRARASARLGLTFGLLLGNINRLQSARGWYLMAARMADRSGDPATQAWVRGRAASRASYEGMSGREALAWAEHALSLSTTGWGALEAHVTRVHVYGLTGRLAEGRTSVADMRRVADAMPRGVEEAGPHERVASLHAYLEGRLGTLRDAHRASLEAEGALSAIPLWLTDARIYAGRAMVTAGDVAGGVRAVLDALDRCPHPTHTLAVGVADVLTVVPADSRSADVERLRTYASKAPGPWETVA